jgi:ATP-dependent Clp protease ATP-binding subunit ClpB
MKAEVTGLLRRSFRPEFLNRLDEIVVFRGLSKAQLREIVDKQVGFVAARLAGRGIGLLLSSAARDYLAEVGYDPTYGARPLKRTIQREVETPLAKKIVAGEIRDGMEVNVDLRTTSGATTLSFEGALRRAA